MKHQLWLTDYTDCTFDLVQQTMTSIWTITCIWSWNGERIWEIYTVMGSI